jgi:hypothetical protein
MGNVIDFELERMKRDGVWSEEAEVEEAARLERRAAAEEEDRGWTRMQERKQG